MNEKFSKNAFLKMLFRRRRKLIEKKRKKIAKKMMKKWACK